MYAPFLGAAWTSAVVLGAGTLTGAPAPELDPDLVTPGLGGFLTFFALALASWFLYRSLAVHMRRIDVRARLQAEEEAVRREDDGETRVAAPADPPGSGPAGAP